MASDYANRRRNATNNIHNVTAVQREICPVNTSPSNLAREKGSQHFPKMPVLTDMPMTSGTRGHFMVTAKICGI
jgi:hypothetical protein